MNVDGVVAEIVLAALALLAFAAVTAGLLLGRRELRGFATRPRVVPVGRRAVVTVRPSVPLTLGVQGSGRFRRAEQPAVRRQRAEAHVTPAGHEGRMAGYITNNPDAVCTVCCDRLSACGGDH